MLLDNFKKRFFPTNLKCFFREEILLAPHTLNDRIPKSFLAALPNDISSYWCPAKDFEVQLKNAIQLVSPRRNSDAFNHEKEYLISEYSIILKCDDDDVDYMNTKETYSFSDYSIDFRSMNSFIFNRVAKKNLSLMSEMFQSNHVTSQLEGFTRIFQYFSGISASNNENTLTSSKKFQKFVSLLDKKDLYILEHLWIRLYILIWVAPNITPVHRASFGLAFTHTVNDMKYESYKVYFFIFWKVS